MNKISLKNFRCFLDVQDVRIAPLTLLVGENSSGKTSFMAMIRALWDVAYGHKVPDFKEEPFDLGSFDEIAHHRGARGSRAETIVAEFEWTHKIPSGVRERFDTTDPLRLSVTFEKRAEAPYPVQRRLESGELWIEEHFGGTNWRAAFGTGRGSWKYSDEHMSRRWNIEQQRDFLPVMWWRYIARDDLAEKLTALKNSPKLCVTEMERLERLAMYLVPFQSRPPYAGAPVRSKPRRTYDPGRSVDDPEGDYIPMFLADMSVSDKSQWSALKGALEKFGKSSGLFDEIIIKHFGKGGSAPFRIWVRKSGHRLKGPYRNLIDVGYGVSQVLPVITELQRHDAPEMFLLQQPEVHLHPSAQAALGSLFCELAGQERQLIVETHSDHLLDRVRMDIRDRRGNLKPDDISILFFERNELDVSIHSIRLDDRGNVLDAPPDYRSFFMEETTRSLGL